MIFLYKKRISRTYKLNYSYIRAKKCFYTAIFKIDSAIIHYIINLYAIIKNFRRLLFFVFRMGI